MTRTVATSVLTIAHRPLAVFASIAVLVAACSNATVTPVPTSSPVGLPEPSTGPFLSSDAAGLDTSVSYLQPVVKVTDGDRGAMLIAGPVAGNPSFIYVDACIWEHDPAGFIATGVGGGILPASMSATVSIDRAGTTTADFPPIEHLLGGRAAANVAAIRVTLSDGSAQKATLSGGYWLAWWDGSQGSASVEALDASGGSLSVTPFTAPGR